MKAIMLILGLVGSIGLTRAEDIITPHLHIELFDGKTFHGWAFCMKGNANPMRTWSVTNGVIRCAGTPTGYIRTTGRYRNYELTVDWRFVKTTPRADNTGVLVHIQSPDKVWPECVQVQGKHDHQGDLFLMAGAESREHHGMNANTPLPKHSTSAEKPVGEWNICQVICSGNTVKAYVNGKFMNETTDCTVSSGSIGIQSEGGDIEIRKISVDPLK